MSETTDSRLRREPIATRIDRAALETIERLAAARRTTPAQVARVLLEDGARALSERAARARWCKSRNSV